MAPKSKRNQAYWNEKFRRNKARDSWCRRELRKLSWKVVVVWECQTKDQARLRTKLTASLGRK